VISLKGKKRKKLLMKDGKRMQVSRDVSQIDGETYLKKSGEFPGS